MNESEASRQALSSTQQNLLHHAERASVGMWEWERGRRGVMRDHLDQHFRDACIFFPP